MNAATAHLIFAPQPNRRIPSVVSLLVCAVLSIMLLGCNSAFYAHRDQLEGAFASGRYDAAAASLDSPASQSLYGEKNRLLYWLDRASVALAMDQHEQAIDLFERAESYMDVHSEATAGDDLARWIINDTAAPYYGEAYEDIYVNVFKLLAQLERGEISGGATVEARRAAGKADRLRDRYIKLRGDVVQSADAKARQGLQASAIPLDARTTAEGEFIESTLGAFLTAVTFMKDGDPQSQGVAGRRLVSAIQLQRGLQPGVNEQQLAEVGTADPSSVNVLIVGLSGRGPTKIAQTIGPIPIFEYPLYFQLPQLVGGSEEVASARVVVDGAQPGTRGGAMVKVEDLRAVAIENHRRAMPLIYARTLIRATAKSAAIFVGAKSIEHGSKRGDTRDAVAIGAIIGGIAAMMLTEEADLRCWQFLPARADAALLNLPPGRHTIRVEFLGASGGVVYTAPPRDIEVSSGPKALSTVVEHFWR